MAKGDALLCLGITMHGKIQARSRIVERVWVGVTSGWNFRILLCRLLHHLSAFIRMHSHTVSFSQRACHSVRIMVNPPIKYVSHHGFNPLSSLIVIHTCTMWFHVQMHSCKILFCSEKHRLVVYTLNVVFHHVSWIFNTVGGRSNSVIECLGAVGLACT